MFQQEEPTYLMGHFLQNFARPDLQMQNEYFNEVYFHYDKVQPHTADTISDESIQNKSSLEDNNWHIWKAIIYWQASIKIPPS